MSASSTARRFLAALLAVLAVVGLVAGCSDDEAAEEAPLEQPVEAKDLDAETCAALNDAIDTLEGFPTGETEGLPAAQAVATLETNLGPSAPLESIKVGVQLINSAQSPEEAETTRQQLESSGGFATLLGQLQTAVDESCA